jgi:hypothetical protein
MSALLQVAELNAAYAATIDADRLEAWPDFFIESCLYKITSADNRKHGYSAGIVYADPRAMLHDQASELYRKFKYRQRRLRSHDYGMVGLIKQLIDELGMDAITNPDRNGSPPQRFPKFQRMEVCPGQVFIVKTTEQDHALLAESLRHPFPKSSAPRV